MTRPVCLIDAGHGGENTGKLVGDFVEKEFTLAVALKLEAALRDGPFDLVLTRNIDADMSLWERGHLAAKHSAPIAISLHANAADNRNWDDLVALYWPESVDGHYMANEIVRCAPLELSPAKAMPALPEGNFAWPRAHNVMSKYPAECIVNLVEFGYATNPRDRHYMESELGQWQCAYTIARGAVALLEKGLPLERESR